MYETTKKPMLVTDETLLNRLSGQIFHKFESQVRIGVDSGDLEATKDL